MKEKNVDFSRKNATFVQIREKFVLYMLDGIMQDYCTAYKEKTKYSAITDYRSIFCYIAVNELVSKTVIAEFVDVKKSSINKFYEKAEALLTSNDSNFTAKYIAIRNEFFRQKKQVLKQVFLYANNNLSLDEARGE